MDARANPLGDATYSVVKSKACSDAGLFFAQFTQELHKFGFEIDLRSPDGFVWTPISLGPSISSRIFRGLVPATAITKTSPDDQVTTRSS